MQNKRRFLGTLICAVMMIALLVVPMLAITASAAEDATTSAGGSWVKKDISEISSTDVVVITMTKETTTWALSSANGTSKAPAATVVSVSNDALSEEPADALKWNIDKNGDNLTIYPNGTTDTWLYCTSTNNGVRVGTNTSKTFTIDSSSGYLKHTGTSRYLGVYNSQDWRCYTNTTGNTAGQTLAFYVYEESAPEGDPTCEHTNTTTTRVEPGKVTAGSITTTCDECGAVTETEEIPALGCNVTFDVPDGATAPAAANGVLNVTMPDAVDAPASFNAQAYKFAGWAMAEVADTNTAPKLYQPGEKVTLAGDTTFYAVYSYGVTGAVVKQYEKVINNLSDYSGTYLIVYESESSAYVFTGVDAANNYVSATISNAIIDYSTVISDYEVTIESFNGGYSIKIAGKYINNTGTSNALQTSATAGKNTISVTNGVAAITGSGGNKLQFYSAANQLRFRYFGSSQKGISLYKLNESEGVATYFTTELEATACQHINHNTETVDATCTDNGSITVTCADCGALISSQVIESKGHNYDDGVVNPAPTCTENGVKTFTCGVCHHSYTADIDALGHNYVDNVCTECGDKIQDYSGRYYIATIRSSGNYFWMTSDLGDASTKRYQAVDSGFAVLPESMAAEAGYVFVLVNNGDGTYSIYAEDVDGDNYLGWSSGNSGILVSADDALKLTVDKNDDGIFNIHFAADVERYLSLNGTANNNYFAFYGGTQKQDLSLVPVKEAEPTEPTIIGAQVNVGADLAIKYHVYLPEGFDVNNFTLKITNGHGTVTVITAEAELVDGNYVFIYGGIAPQCMSDNISAVLLNGESEVASVPEYSIVQNAKNLAAQEGATVELKQFLADLLAYGMAAQAHLGDAHSVSQVTDDDIAAIGVASDRELPAENVNTGDPTENAYISGAGVRFDNQVQIYVTVKGTDLNGAKVVVNGATYEVVAAGNRIYLSGMSMTEISEALTIELYVDDACVHTVVYGVYDYVARMQDSATADLAKALYNCAESAKEYLNLN